MHTHTQTHTHTHAPAMHICVHWTPHDHPCVSILVAPPPVMALDSTESGSDIRITWNPPGMENGDYFYQLSVSFRSTFSNIQRERSEQGSFVHKFARIGTDGIPFSFFLLINTSNDDNQQQVAASNTLLHRIRSSAFYEISLAGVNQNLGVPSVFIMSTLTTSRTRK